MDGVADFYTPIVIEEIPEAVDEMATDAGGDEVAAAARNGFQRVWRNWSPPLPHERAGENAVEHGVVVGVMERAKQVGLSRLAIATKGG